MNLLFKIFVTALVLAYIAGYTYGTVYIMIYGVYP